MPYLQVNGADLYYTEHGAGPESIVFSHGLLMNGDMFGDQVKALSDRYRCITYDHRGQGRSSVTKSGYDMDSLTQDAMGLIRALDSAPCHFVGLSMGGFVGMRLAIRHPELLQSLTLIETSADAEPEQNKGPYRRLAFLGRWLGFRFVAGPVMKIMFGRKFLDDPQRRVQREHWKSQLIANNRTGTSRAAHGVIDRESIYPGLGDIDVPTLIIVGDQDVATPLSKSERMQAAIKHSKLVLIPGAGHSSTIEEPEETSRALSDFIGRCAVQKL